MPQFGRRVRRLIISVTASLSLAAGGVALAPSPATAAPADQKLKDELASVMSDPRVTEANSGAVVLDPRKKKELYSRNATEAITPASNTKILTAAAAMRTLGPDYRFKTEVITRGPATESGSIDRLYLKGYGDPTTLQSDYRDLAEQVREAGITRVKGNLVVDDSFFDEEYYHPNWSPSYLSEYYAAQISALTVAPDTDYDAGTVIVTYSPGSEGEPAEYTLTPASAAKYVKIKNTTTTVAEGEDDSFGYERAEDTNTITLSGNVPLDAEPTKEWVTVHHPHLYAGAVFRAELAKAGVTVEKSTIRRETPAGKRNVVAVDRSMKLSELLHPFMKLSNNGHAEHLTKTMAARKGTPGNWADGTTYLEKYVRRSQAPTDDLTLVDGSGLSRENKITPRVMTKVLAQARHETWFPAFEDSLPLAGNPDRMIGGTLSSRMRDTPAANNARGKTGSLTGVTALSGYVRDQDDRLYIFSMLSEYDDETPRPVEDLFATTLASHSR